ncbi:EamA family transporter [Winogradskyella sp. F6397]|uniref:EamA family transporter n=1 Tax=Winogradskyella marina TaxID=2785530 RepID=A0ABS0EMH3_9FLAO|nr:DMT family transporter [Winogradskyella marina]MBF8149906.1 EamA family transporter [Winogradskyella marina]
MKVKNNYKVWFYFIALVLIWGSSFILIKNGLNGYTVWQAATIRLVSAFFVMFFFAIRHIRKIPSEKVPVILLVSLLSMVFPSYLFSIAQSQISSALAGILNALVPMFTSVLGLLFFRKSINKLQWLGLAIGFISASFLILITTGSTFSLNEYALLIIVATICYGLNFNIVKTYLSDVNSLHVTTIAVSFSGIFGFLFLFFSGYDSYINVSEQQVFPLLSLITLGVLGTALAQFMQNQLIQKSSAVFASSLTYLIPVVAVLWGVLDGEKLVFWHYLGMLGILIGVLILNKFGKSKNNLAYDKKTKVLNA